MKISVRILELETEIEHLNRLIKSTDVVITHGDSVDFYTVYKERLKTKKKLLMDELMEEILLIEPHVQAVGKDMVNSYEGLMTTLQRLKLQGEAVSELRRASRYYQKG